MDTIEIGPYLIAFDRRLTMEAYARIQIPGPEQCGCWHCRNWVAGRETLVPREVRKMLEQFGIPVSGEIEVWQVPGDDGQHIYGGWYMFAGQITSGPKDWRDGPTVEGWQIHFSEGQSYEVEAFASVHACEMNFIARSVEDFIEPPAGEVHANRDVSISRLGAIRRMLARFGIAI